LRQDVAEAVKWYRKSAEQDFAEADLQLGQLYYSGDVGIDKNYPEAAKWLTKAAEHGKLWAQNTLGVMYEEGYGVDKDPKQAFNWFRGLRNEATQKHRAISVICTLRESALKKIW
jgi:TPR repeat protein